LLCTSAFDDRLVQLLELISCFILGLGFKWWEGPVWLFWSTNCSYQWWCPSRNNTPTSAWVRFDYKSYCYIFFDHKESMPLCRIYVI